MEFEANLRFTKAEKKVKDDNIFYIGTFLDNDDNKLQFFIDEKLYNTLINKKKYDPVKLNLNLYQSNKGRYGLGVVL